MSKGDWKRHVDPRYEKESEATKKKLFGGRCRLPHEHGKDCPNDEVIKKN